jgi:hypothetical protein
MAKTILELFRTKPIGDSGKTAQQTYGVRNSKDIGIQTSSVVLNNSSVYAINLVRRGIGIRRGESVAEQELTGIRPLYVLSSPFIYGTDIKRITEQRTSQVEGMKSGANGGGGSDGVIGQALNRVGSEVRKTAQKLGVKFPSDLNPTSYYEQLDVKNKSEIPKILSKIKGDAAGNLAGQILSQPQTPSQLVKTGTGAALSFVKKKVQGFLIGERSTTGFAKGDNRIDKPTQTINYGSDTNGINIQAQLGDVIDAGGMSYSKTIENIVPIDTIKPSSLQKTIDFVDGSDEGEYSLANKIDAVLLETWDTDSDGSKRRKIQSNDNNYSKVNGPNGVVLNPTFTDPLIEQESIENSFGTPDNPYSLYTKSKNAEKIAKIQDFDKNRDFANKITKFTRLEVERGKKILSQRGFGEGTRTKNGTVVSNDPYRDVINLSSVFDSDENNTILGDNVDDLNFIPLKFTLISNNRTVHFRSSIDGISETFSPSWDSAKFIGNPFSYYTYSGIERSVSFNLKVMATSANELKSNWERLSFLSSLTYPAAYQTDTSYIIPPFIKFTLGDMYKGKEGFIESLSYAVDDVAGWEIGLNSGMEKYKLPKKIDVSLTIKFVETRNNTSDYKKLYSFGPVS